MLRGLSSLLIVETPEAPLDVLVVVNGFGCYEEASRRLSANPDAELWLFDREPNRLQQRGILPPALECARAACDTAAIPPQQVRVQPRTVAGTRSLLDEIGRLAEVHPSRRIGMVTDEWNSRWLADQLSSRVSNDVRTRVVVVPVAHPAVPRTTWWHTKPARRRVSEAALKRFADWVIVDSDEPVRRVTDEELRRAGVAP